MGNALTCKAGCRQQGTLLTQANYIYNVGTQKCSLLDAQVYDYFHVSSQGGENIDELQHYQSDSC